MAIVQQWAGEATKTVRWTTAVVDGLLEMSPELAPGLLGDVSSSRRRLVVIDGNVRGHYGHEILCSLPGSAWSTATR